MKTAIALVDDHVLLRKGLSEMLISKGFDVLFEASNGQELIDTINPQQLPSVILMDIAMPLMNGFETTKWLKENYPQIQVLALSMFDSETNIIRMLRLGAKGYMLKDCNPDELVVAIHTVVNKGFYFSELVNENLVKAIEKKKSGVIKYTNKTPNFSEKEIMFIELCCRDLAYKQIATEMSITPKTVEGYREELFEKCGVRSRIGLVMFAIKNGIFNL